jgi:hypothetical protein
MTSVALNVKVEANLKQQLIARADDLGLTLAGLVNAVLTQTVKAKTLILTPKAETATQPETLPDEPSPKLAKMLLEAKAEYERGECYGPFTIAESSVFLNSLMKKPKQAKQVKQAQQ